MSMWDDEAGYSRDDPKHPGWADMHAERADHGRKAVRESAPADDYETLFARAVYVAEHLAQMIDRDTWRSTDDDEHRWWADQAEQLARYVLTLRDVYGQEHLSAPASQDAPEQTDE